MKRLTILLLVAMVAAAAFSLTRLDRQISFDAVLEGRGSSTRITAPLAAPVPLGDGDAIAVSASGHGSDHVGVMRIRLEGAPLDVIVGDGRTARRQTCTDECQTVLRATGGNAATARIVSASGISTLRDLTFEPATAKRHSGASGMEIFAGFGLLLLFGPAFVWLRRWPGAEQVALAVGGLVWTAYASLAGFAIALVFVLASYLVIRRVSTITDGRTRALAAALAGVILIVVLLKFAAPVMASSFANPGGLWLALPLGVSYLAIRVVDLILAAHARALRGLTFRDYIAFMLSPYTLPAGPIQLYSDFRRGRIENWSGVDFIAGAARLGVGVTKKVLADSLLLPVVTGQMDQYLSGAGEPQRYVVIMLAANLLYVYLDFSAYCDLAIGAARAGGRRLPENFNWPLVRSGLRSYWRHWHMTLSQWVMRRVYFPAFLASHSTTLALVASMLTIGLWHAPTISWSLWALHHSLAMDVEGRVFPAPAGGRSTPRSLLDRFAQAARHVTGMGLMLGWVSLGHSFTLFANPRIALETYLLALTAPIGVAWRLVS